MSEGLKIARLMMVLSSVSPLFVIWAIRGNRLIPDQWFLLFCALMIVIPNGFLWLRIATSKKNKEQREFTIGKAEDHRTHVLVYLFAMLLPFYTPDIATWRDFAATLTAIAFIVFLFWHLNLHYMNILFALFGYRVFTLYPEIDANPLSGKLSYVLITAKLSVAAGDRIQAYRLSDTVYLDTHK